jgi:hypothetical protein
VSVNARASVTAGLAKEGSRKPVCAGNVKTDRHGNSLGAQTGTAPNYTEQPERRNEFAKELTAT